VTLSTRLKKLESLSQSPENDMAVVTCNYGDNQEEVIQAWRLRTGLPDPKLFILITKFGEEDCHLI
jgi:hypothetical protein